MVERRPSTLVHVSRLVIDTIFPKNQDMYTEKFVIFYFYSKHKI